MWKERLWKDFAVMMDRWADKGFWREDVLNYEGETRELFYAGQSGADQHHTQTFVTGITNNMNEKQPGSDPKFYPFCATSENLVRDIVTHGACAVGANSDNAERALMVYDINPQRRSALQIVQLWYRRRGLSGYR